MNRDEITGGWKQLKGRARQAWGALTGSGRARADGLRERMVGRAQLAYGKSRARAERAFDSWMGRL